MLDARVHYANLKQGTKNVAKTKQINDCDKWLFINIFYMHSISALIMIHPSKFAINQKCNSNYKLIQRLQQNNPFLIYTINTFKNENILDLIYDTYI